MVVGVAIVVAAVLMVVEVVVEMVVVVDFAGLTLMPLHCQWTQWFRLIVGNNPNPMVPAWEKTQLQQ
jgi:hypothetical protein